MRICLINPRYVIDDVFYQHKYIDSGFNVANLGIGYIASYLELHGYEVDILDNMYDNLSDSDIINQIQVNNYAMIGISVCDQSRIYALKLIKKFKNLNINTPIILGGYSATLSFKGILDSFPGITCCVLGEGEETVLELANCISEKRNWKNVDGIAYKDNDKLVINKKRALISDLDELPFPKRKHVDANYSVTIIGSRGCLNDCIYCSISSFYKQCLGRKYRFRSAENIINELLFLKNNYNIHSVTFYDDNFLAYTKENLSRLENFYELFKKNIGLMDFSLTTRAEDIVRNKDILLKFKEIGLKHIFVGIETFSQRQLDFYNKRTNTEINLEALKILKELKLTSEIGFIPLEINTTLNEIVYNYTTLKNSDYFDTIFRYGKRFSTGGYLMAVQGTKFRNFVNEEEKYVNNERGYVFSDPSVEKFFFYLNKWSKIISTLDKEMFLCSLAKDKQDFICEKICIEINKLVTMLDVDFIIQLSTFLINNEDVNLLFTEYERKVSTFKKIYSYIGNLIGVGINEL